MAFGDKIWYGDGHEGLVVDKNTIYRAYPLRIEQVDAFLKGWKECLEQMGKNPYTPKRILRSGPATIVFWEDGTKTVVKRASVQPDNPYDAFTSALAIKVFGSNSQVKSVIKHKTEE